MSTIQFDPTAKRGPKPATPAGNAKPLGSGDGQTGPAGNPGGQNPEGHSKGAVRTETVTATGPKIVIDGDGAVHPEFEQPKRGRGRPPGSGNTGGGNSGGGKRGRPKKTEAAPIEGISFAILSIHTMLAAMSKNPTWNLSATESEELAKSIAKVQEHYPMVVDPKAQAWIGLAMVAGMIYVPRVMELRKPKPKPVQAQAQPQNTQATKTEAAKKAAPDNKTGPLSPADLYGPLGARG